MKIVKQSHEILHMDSIDRIETAGRTCYKSKKRDTNGTNGTNMFVKGLIKRGHEAMIEHANATVRFITNRGVTHELVRHRLCAFGQESTRYVSYFGDDIRFIEPVWGTDTVWINAMIVAERYYKALVHNGWRLEQAREVLPNSLKTEIVVTANFREWRHIFKLRALGTTGRPHPQMKALMLPVLLDFAEREPAAFGDLLEEE